MVYLCTTYLWRGARGGAGVRFEPQRDKVKQLVLVEFEPLLVEKQQQHGHVQAVKPALHGNAFEYALCGVCQQPAHTPRAAHNACIPARGHSSS